MFEFDACCYGVNGDGETYARLAADIVERDEINEVLSRIERVVH